MAEAPEVDAELARIIASFAGEVREWLHRLDAAARTFAEATSENEARQALEEISLLAHKLSGSAGTFGFVAISEAATPLELRCAALLGGDGAVTDEQRQEIVTLNAAVQRVADEKPDPSLL
jgi:HPt (histidine-containing phosphotransfer) domain-containing protein